MSDFAGVDPHRLRLLANRLEDLADTLDRQGAVIRRLFADWDGNLDLGAIAHQAHHVHDDARDMARRADRALSLFHESNFLERKTAWVSIPWDVSKIDTAREAQQEATDLKNAMANSHDAPSREIIAEIAQSLADHLDDPAYLSAFMRYGGMGAAAQAARVLHDQDGTHDGEVLSADSQKIVGQFAAGTHAYFAFEKDGKVPGPAPDCLRALTSPPDGDMWSVGMLFKYGPPGGAWDPSVLSAVGGAMLDWRAKQKKMRPDYSQADPPYSAGGYVGKNDGGWYHSLGLDPDYLTHGPDADNRIVEAIRGNDPALVLVSRLAENAQASRGLLGHDDAAGRRFARQLVDYTWQTPGETTWDDSDAVRRVLTLAATDRSPAHQDQSGQAADNILTAAAAMKDAFDGRNPFEAEEYATYPKGTAIALAGITATWADDLGGTSLTAVGRPHGYENRVLGSNQTDLVKVMQLFVKDNPGAAAMFDTALHAQVSEAAGSRYATDDLMNMGNLAGIFAKAKVGISYTQAQQIDEDHTFNLTVLNTAASLFGYIPGPAAADGEALTTTAKVLEKGLKYSQNLVAMGTSIAAPQIDPFSTDNAANQELLNEEEAKNYFKKFSPAIAQGLIRSGRIPPPKSYSWYDPKTQTITANASNNSFDTWWSGEEIRSVYLNTFASGFRTAEGTLDGQ